MTARSMLGGWKPRGASLGDRQESTSSVGVRAGEEGIGQACRVAEARRDGSPRRKQRGRHCLGALDRHPRARCFVQSRKISKDPSSLFLDPSFDTSPLFNIILFTLAVLGLHLQCRLSLAAVGSCSSCRRDDSSCVAFSCC